MSEADREPGQTAETGVVIDGAVVDRSAGNGRDGVAIVGMACLFPSAPNVDAYWRNILTKVDAISDPPPEAWDAGVYYDPDSPDTDRVYCKRGGYLGALAAFDPLAHNVPPVAVGGEPDQWLALRVAREAMADAGYSELDEKVRHRTAVVLGKGTYLNGGNAIAVQHGIMVGQTLEILKSLHPELTDAQLELLRRELKSTLPPIGPETVPGLIPNVIVGRIANRLDLMGPAYTVDAACASSLIAVQLAMRDLVNGECDLALAGGSQVWIPVPTLNVFCQLGALSRRQQIRPFDKDADGTLLGEGIGMVVLKRVADAERDGDRIYAIVRGVGVASDGHGTHVLAPRPEGEELALRRAYETAGVAPETVELIEAHGTGTPVGDVVEVEALSRVFGLRDGELPRIALGSVKSMISHTIPAAGVASIIKVALGLYHKVLPPTLNCSEPNPKLELGNKPFYLNTEVRPWIHGGDEPRRAGVNGFGFGGINAHAVLEEYVPKTGSENGNSNQAAPSFHDSSDSVLSHLPDWDTEVCILEADSPAHLLERVERLRAFLASVEDATESLRLSDIAYTLGRTLGPSANPYRLAVVASSLADLSDKLQRAAQRLADPNCARIKDVSGIYFASQPLGKVGKVAFLFPGEGAQYPNMLADLCLHFPEVRAWFDQSDSIFSGRSRGYLPSDVVFPRPAFTEAEQANAEQRLMQINAAIESVLTANQGMLSLLRGLGLTPDAVLGHSTGEYSAMFAAGILDLETNERRRDFSRKLTLSHEEAVARDGVPQASLLAVGADRDTVESLVRETPGVYVAMDNCPHQVVVVGGQEAVASVVDHARTEGLIYEELAFDRPYHTELFTSHVDPLRKAFQETEVFPARTPIYSCATAAPYPQDPGGIRQLMLDQWVQPVEFTRTIETLYEEGFRVFVEAGPRGNLSAFVEDVLRGRQFCAVPANVQRRSGITQLNHLVGVLAAEGIALDPTFLFKHRTPRVIDWEAGLVPSQQRAPRVSEMLLATSLPMMRLTSEVALELREHGIGSVGRAEPQQQPIEVGRSAAQTSPEQAAQSRVIEAEPFNPPSRQPQAPAREVPLADVAPGSVGGANGQTSFPIERSSESAGADGRHVASENGRGYDEEHATPQPSAWVVPSNVSPTARAMHGYLRTMEDFLTVQQDVMQAYLVAGTVGAAAATPPPALPAPGFETVAQSSPPPAPTQVALGTSDVVGEPEIGADGAVFRSEADVPETPVQRAQIEHRPAQEPSSEPLRELADDHANGRPSTTSGEGSRVGDQRAVVAAQLLELVSERTGYPAEMLDPALDLEADLGIDSIKRVEILGSYRQKAGDLGVDLEQLSTKRTLQEIIDVLVPGEPLESSSPVLVAENNGAERATQLDEAPTATADTPGTASERRSLVAAQLLELVSERTGYPAEMLDPTLDLEADLGIDSIKRVEILGSYRQKVGDLGVDLEQLSTKRTLEEIIGALTSGVEDGTSTSGLAEQPAPAPRVETDTRQAAAYPLLGTVDVLTPGEHLVAQRVFDLAEDLYLRDHTLGRNVSLADKDLLALVVMPLTMSFEIMAEAAACLLPGRKVIGLRDVRAYRWLVWEDSPQTLQVTARRIPGQDGADGVAVQVRNLSEDQASGEPSKSPAIEAVVLLAESYTSAPSVATRTLRNARPSRWLPEELYTNGMFHGPAWQGVAAMEETAEDGAQARLRVLPFAGFLKNTTHPEFVLDPVTLDAAGQVVGFWTLERLENGKIIFPFRLAALDVYGPLRRTGEVLTCRASIQLTEDRLVSSDLDVLSSDGQLWMRLVGWEDKRFELPSQLYPLMLPSHRVEISSPWPEPIRGFPQTEQLACHRVPAAFAADGMFWKRVWAQRTLSAAEREQFRQLRLPEHRQIQWLAGRAAAKGALQQLLRERYGLDLPPADIEIRSDEHGRPLATGPWASQVPAPAVSITHTNAWAAAFARLSTRGADDRWGRVGIDIEQVGGRREGFADVAFKAEERELVRHLEPGQQEEWLLRLWCAKEAVAKAAGLGLVEGPPSVSIASVDVERDLVTVRLTGQLATACPDLSSAALIVHVGCHDDLVVATTLCEPGDSPFTNI